MPLVLLGLYDYSQKNTTSRNYPIGRAHALPDRGDGPGVTSTSSRMTRTPSVRLATPLGDLRASQERRGQEAVRHRADVRAGYSWLTHSIAAPAGDREPRADLRTTVGGPSATAVRRSILNISAISFGALRARPLSQRSTTARRSRLRPDTGEGGCRPTTRPGGDLIWQIGTGYFGCRTPTATSAPSVRTNAPPTPQVEDDRDQGLAGRQAGPWRILPAAKVTRRSPTAWSRGQGRLLPDLPQGVLDTVEMTAFIASCAS